MQKKKGKVSNPRCCICVQIDDFDWHELGGVLGQPEAGQEVGNKY
jgi:hypothetical protein